jgi:tRNA dimethylallyltransferase
MAPLPEVGREVRAQLLEDLSVGGLDSLFKELQRVDESTAAKLHATDTQRILRALEVARGTEKPLSKWIQEKPFGSEQIASIQIGLTLPRGILYDRIAGRVRTMMAQGWLAEIEELLSSGANLSDPAFQALGYRQLGAHLKGEISLEAAVKETIRATRRFAKRQTTWFRREHGVTWFDAQRPQEVVEEVAKHLVDEGFKRQND